MLNKVNAIDTNKLVNKTDYDAKIKDIEDEIPSITDLATTGALTAVKKKIPTVNTFAKKAYYDENYQKLRKTILPYLLSIIHVITMTILPYHNKCMNNMLDSKIKSK